jgi:cellulose synthase/poly-beta-1,6-N-acetylglucosamine synthase-like glycosyltransferase
LEKIEKTLALARDFELSAVVVDDGSVDGSSADLRALCDRYHIQLLRHESNRGKPEALNTGVGATRTELVATIDADTLIAGSDLLKAAQAFLDNLVGAVAVEVRAEERDALSAVQAFEYRYQLDFDRQGLSGLGEIYTVPGAASLWRRQALVAIGGFSDRTLAEDTDATISLRAWGWHAIALATATSTTAVPHTLPLLVRQRIRWIWGPLQASIRQAFSVAGCRVPYSHPGIIFGALSGLNLAGFVLPVWGALELVTGQLHATTRYAIVAQLAIGCIRLTVALWFRDGSLARLPTLIGSSLLIQSINTISFWTGLLVAAPVRRRWR